MSGKLRTLWLALILAGIAVGGGVIYARWQAGQPSKERFERVVARLLKEEGATSYTRCIRVPGQHDTGRRVSNSLAWHTELPEGAADAKQDKRRQQLDALAGAGLLRKSQIVMRKDGAEIPVTRYQLSDAGWAATIDSRDPFCFPYGQTSFGGVTRFERAMLSVTAGIEVYVVTGVVVVDESKLPPWAAGAELRAAFPEIDEDIAGREFKVSLVRGGGDWVPYATLGKEDRLRAERERDAAQMTPELKLAIEKMRAEDKEWAASWAKLKPPDEAEIRRLLLKQYEDSGAGQWPVACVALPGSERMPVDAQLHLPGPLHDIPLATLRIMFPNETLPGPAYGFAIHVDKPRDPRDPIAARTIPYAERLVAIGFLTKRHDPAFVGKDKQPHASDIYEVSPAMAGNIQPKRPECPSLGVPNVEIVALRVETDPEFHIDTLKYRLRLRYPHVPRWMLDPELQSKWLELREWVEGGMACEGEFGFDRRTREIGSGSGGCYTVSSVPR